METTSTYFTRRAREERTSAVDAVCAAARSAHLELALRFIKAATQPALWSRWSSAQRVPLARAQNDDAAHDVASALRGAFPLPETGAFQHLLIAVDRSTERS